MQKTLGSFKSEPDLENFFENPVPPRPRVMARTVPTGQEESGDHDVPDAAIGSGIKGLGKRTR